jgi:hypothetical protein
MRRSQPSRFAWLIVPALFACSTPTRPAESVGKAELAVQQASTDPATAQHAPLDLELAREKLARAEKALHDDDYEKARRLGDEALVDALVADAKADTQESRATAQALQQSIQSLRSETEHSLEGVTR